MNVLLPKRGAWVAELGRCQTRPQLARVRSVRLTPDHPSGVELDLVFYGSDGGRVKVAQGSGFEVCGAGWHEIERPDFASLSEDYGADLVPKLRRLTNGGVVSICGQADVAFLGLLRIKNKPKAGDRVITNASDFLLEVTAVDDRFVSWRVFTQHGKLVATERWTREGWSGCVVARSRLPDGWDQLSGGGDG